MKPLFKILASVILFTYLPLISQNVAYFDQFGIKDGLSQSSINALVQDKLGIFWFATQDGLNRYSYHENKIFNHIPFDKNSISGNQINDLFTDKEGNIWILSNGGIDYINPINFKITNVLKLKNCKEFESISKAWLANTYLILNTNKGIFVVKDLILNPEKFEKIDFKFKTEGRFSVIAITPITTDNYLLSTNHGFANLYVSSKSVELNKYLINFKKPYTHHLKNNVLTFSDKNILYQFNFTTHQFKTIHEFPNLIRDFRIHTNKEVWVGTEGSGVFVLKPDSNDLGFKIKNHYYSSNNGNEYFKCNYITKIHIDTTFVKSNVWIGTKDEGAFCYNYNKNIFNFLSQEAKLPETNFFAITKDKDEDTWIVSVENLYCINKETKTWKSINIKEISDEAARPIESIVCDINNTIWFGLGNALYKVEKSRFKLEKVIPGILPSKTNQVLKITVINNDNLLLANSEGLTIYNITNKTTENIQEIEYNKSKFEVKRINAAFIDSKNNWWLRTSKGLLVYNRNTSFAKLFEHSPNNPNSLISNTILDINELKSGEIILGTIIGFSILKDLEKGVFKNFPKSSSFKNSVVYSVIPDKEGNVWMTTNFGIYIFNPTNETFICFDSESGGFINEYNSGSFYFDQNNTMILGGIGGVVEANPNKIFTKVDTLPIYTTLYYNGKNNFINTFSESNKVTLNYNNSEIEFQFDLPYYFNNNLDIQYKIEEANSNWQNIGTNQFLRQENLASGKYTFQFRVEDKTGRIKFKEVSYVVIVKPPFWYAGWFYLLLVVLISTVFYIFYKIRLNRKINRLKEIENVRFEENEKVRKAAAMDLHDEFGNGLTRISMLVEVAKDKLPPESKDVLSYLNTISESSGRLYQGTKDFIWSINPNNETLFETIIRIKDYADEIFTGTGTLFELTGLSEELKQIKNTPSVNRNITMIFKESLSNILKHAGAKEVKLIIQLNDKDFFITLKDNGKGFDVNKTKGGFGLGNIKLRAKKIDAEIEFKSEIGVGTELILKHKI